MGLFNFFKKNQQPPKSIETSVVISPGNKIPKEISIEEKYPLENSGYYSANGESGGIEAIYSFLQADYESKGYYDALISPDESNKKDNIRLIQLDLEILFQKVNTYYRDSVKEIDFHMSSRTRAGLIDLVEELKTRREMVLEHMGKMEEIKKEMDENSGMSQRIILSYQRGFMKGIIALTQSKVLNKKM